MLPESLVFILICWLVTVALLILSDVSSFERNWVNMKIKSIAIIFSTAAIIFSILPQRFDIATSSNTVVFFNQTVDLKPPGAGGLTTPIDFLRFIISLLLTVVTAMDFLVTAMEDAM